MLWILMTGISALCDNCDFDGRWHFPTLMGSLRGHSLLINMFSTLFEPAEMNLFRWEFRERQPQPKRHPKATSHFQIYGHHTFQLSYFNGSSNILHTLLQCTTSRVYQCPSQNASQLDAFFITCSSKRISSSLSSQVIGIQKRPHFWYGARTII